MTDLIRECALQWPGFLKVCASDASSGTVWEGDGVGAAWANTPFSICNGTYLTSPVNDAGDMERRLGMAAEFAAGADLPWIFYICKDWIPPELYPDFEAAATRAGLTLIIQMTGMVATELRPPRRPAPALEIEPIQTEAQRLEATDLQAYAYSFPVDLCRTPTQAGALWGKTPQFAYIGYADGMPASTATTLVIDGVLYVALVATHPQAQRRGYAEAVMRHSLAEASRATGLSRTVLHASQAGYPIYAAMGYQPTGAVAGFGPPH